MIWFQAVQEQQLGVYHQTSIWFLTIRDLFKHRKMLF